MSNTPFFAPTKQKLLVALGIIAVVSVFYATRWLLIGWPLLILYFPLLAVILVLQLTGFFTLSGAPFGQNIPGTIGPVGELIALVLLFLSYTYVLACIMTALYNKLRKKH